MLLLFLDQPIAADGKPQRRKVFYSVFSQRSCLEISQFSRLARNRIRMLRTWGEQGTDLGRLIFVDEKSTSQNEFGGMVRSLCELWELGELWGTRAIGIVYSRAKGVGPLSGTAASLMTIGSLRGEPHAESIVRRVLSPSANLRRPPTLCCPPLISVPGP